MKIGLLSYHKNYNYGWNLQCYALITVLKSMGHDVTLIDKRKFHNHKPYARIKHAIKTICSIFLPRGRHISYEKEQEYRGQKIEVFFKNYISPRTKVITSKSEYKTLPHFDALVVGSDQVWRKKLVNPIFDYFFDFINYPVILISYAASFGVDYAEYTDEEVRYCGNLIKKFKAVSVREQSGIKLIKDIYKWNCNPVVMPDPTLLLSSKDYNKIINKIPNKKVGLFCYILDKTKDKEKVVDILSTTYSLNTHFIYLNDDNKPICPSVEEWLSSFRDADFVFTDSFHGCVFSIIYKKPFIAYGNVSRGLSRFTSLLNIFRQDYRLIKSSSDLDDLLLNRLRKVEYEEFDNILKLLHSNATNFLSCNLKNNL